jgi:ABC-2 type transport system ATP-binding protein
MNRLEPRTHEPQPATAASAFELHDLTKQFGSVTALDQVTLSVPSRSVVGLIGRNGSGKTTLLRHLVGLLLPTRGSCTTLGTPSDRLGPAELSRIGVVNQENRFIDWMTVEEHIRYVGSFYPRWDRGLETRLLKDLELDRRARVGTLSPGNVQKLAIILAVGHHPELLLLDEPVSALDPISRAGLLRFLLELLQEGMRTIVISSHVLTDIEKMVDHVICLHQGKLKVSAGFDELRERYCEWMVTSKEGLLPVYFPERYVVGHQGNSFQAVVSVRDGGEMLQEFRRRYRAEVAIRPLNLERLFPLLLEEKV